MEGSAKLKADGFKAAEPAAIAKLDFKNARRFIWISFWDFTFCIVLINRLFLSKIITERFHRRWTHLPLNYPGM